MLLLYRKTSFVLGRVGFYSYHTRLRKSAGCTAIHQRDLDSTDAEVIQPKEEGGHVHQFGPRVANEKLSTDDV